MPEYARPCPIAKNRLARRALVAPLHPPRGAAQRGATGRNILLHLGFARTKPSYRKHKLSCATPECYKYSGGAKMRLVRRRSTGALAPPNLKLTLFPPAIYCPALYSGNGWVVGVDASFSMRPEPFLALAQMLMEICHASESRTQKNRR